MAPSDKERAQSERRLAAIMFTDIVGYTALMAESEERGLHVRERHRAVLAPLAERYHGQIVDENGDELVLSFLSALDAVNCALAVQSELCEDPDLKLRVGIHLGDVVFDGGRIYGDGVNVASRVRPFAEPGGVCVSEQVYDSIKNQPNVEATSLGSQELKNVARPVEVFSLSGTAVERVPTQRARGRHPVRTPFAVASSVVLVLALAIWASWPRPLGLLIDLAGVGGPPVDPPLPDKPSIAVLPFANMSGDPEQEYFSDGISEDVTTALAGSPYLFVISRNSAFTYKDRAVKVEDVGRELGVRYVLEGSVRKADERVRITGQLIDVTTGGHLWSQRYDRDLSDILALQSEIAEAILGAVGVEIVEAEARRLARQSTESLTAMDAVWKGRFDMGRGTRKGHEQAIRLFERAIELDPDSAVAHGMLGAAHATVLANGWSSDPNLVDRAAELGRRALELDPSAAEGHMSIAWVNLLRGNSAEAIAATDRVIERTPNFDWAHTIRGLALAQDARFLEATRSIRRALRLNPRAPSGLLGAVALVNYGAGRRDEAVEMWERVREASPELLFAQIPLAAHYERDGQHGRASALVEEILQVRPDFTVQKAIDQLPGMERALGAEEFARYTDALRKAGLPE